MKSKEGTEGEMRPPRAGHRVALVLGLLALIALCLRLYRITAQSAWLDEYYVMAGLDTSSFADYMSYLQFHVKDNVPLYHFLFYWWMRFFGGTSVFMARLLPILFSVACIPLLYVFVRSAFGKSAALIAALCLAISPTQIWFAQSIRNTTFWQLLVILSFWELYRAVSHGRTRDWIAVVAINLLLVWTHPFSVFAIAIQCLYVLWMLWPHMGRIVAWGVLQGVICFTIYFWLHNTLESVATPEEDFAYQIPPVKALLADLFADDAVMTNDPFAYQGETWKFLSPGIQRAIIDVHPHVDWLMIGCSGICVLIVLVIIARALFSSSFRARHFPSKDAFHGAVLLLAVGLLPLLIQLLMSILWRPIMLPRYTSYSALGILALIGAAIASIQYTSVRRLAMALLLGLYAYQLSLALPATTRTDYIAAARHLAANAAPDDIAFVAGTYDSWQAFRYTAGKTPYLLLPAYSLTAIAEKSVRVVQEGRARTAWALLDPFVFTLPPRDQFEQLLQARALAFTRTDFPGMNGLFLYRIQKGVAASPPAPPPPPLAAVTPYDSMLDDLGYTGDDRSQAAEILRLVWDVEFPRTRLYYTMLALQLTGERYHEMALRAVDQAIALDPKDAFAHFARAIIRAETGELSDARKSLDTASTLDTVGFVQRYAPLLEALYWQPDPGAAAGYMRELECLHVYMPVALSFRAGLFPVGQALRLQTQP